MDNWRPSSLREVWEESYPGDKPPNSFIEWILSILLSLFLGFFFFLYRFPVAGVQLISLIQDPSWLQGIGFLLAILLSLMLQGIAIYQQSFNALKSILRYLKFDLAGKFSLEERSIEEYIGSGKVQEILAARAISWASDNQYPICRVFIRHCSEESPIQGQKKGFSAPVGYYSIGLPPRPVSLVFIDDPPNQSSCAMNFFIYHEIGHTTKHAWRIKTRPYITGFNIVLLVIWIVLNTSNYFISVLPLLLYGAIRGFFEMNPWRNDFEDEVIANTFAIRRFPDNIPLTSEDSSKENRRNKKSINLESFLEKHLSPSNRDGVYMEMSKMKQLENVKDIIKARKEGRVLSIFEIGRRTLFGDVLLLDVLLIVSAIPVQSPSLWFFVGILVLTILMFFVSTFIYVTRLIPVTNLVEESLNQLTSNLE